jgi:hypothetical protein
VNIIGSISGSIINGIVFGIVAVWWRNYSGIVASMSGDIVAV